MAIDFVAEAEALRDALIARRRDLHQFPELAFEENRTSGIVARELMALGIEVQLGVGRTGVVGVLEGGREGKTVLIRADMDALPIHEETGAAYASTVPGKMHACGHDGHTSIALGVAKLLAAHRDQIAGRVKFVFQPAEEIAAGAKAMVADGVLDDPALDVSLGLHLWNSLPLGTVGVTDGASMAGSSTFTITITGKGSHAATPDLGVDPVVCAAQLITAAQTIVSRNVRPLDSAVITFAVVRAGEASNVIPETVTVKGTIRTFTPDVRDLVSARLEALTRSLCAAMGCTVEIGIRHQTQPVANDPVVAARLRQVFAGLTGVQTLSDSERTMGAEDVGEFMTTIPGVYFFVGAKDTTQPDYYGHHHPRFSFDEGALPLGVALLAAAAAAYVMPDEA